MLKDFKVFLWGLLGYEWILRDIKSLILVLIQRDFTDFFGNLGHFKGV